MTIERFAYKPLRQAPRVSAIITALGVGIFLENFTLALNPYPQHIPTLIENVTWTFGGVSVSLLEILIIGLSVGLMLMLDFIVRRTMVGMAMRAISWDKAVVPLMGVPVNLVISVTFALGTGLGGAAAAVVGLIVAIPSFRTRGDYLAIVTLAFNMIVKSVIENIDAIGGPRGFLGMEKLTTLPWVFFWTVLAVWVIRNLIYSNFGRGVLSIREDEIASDLMSVNTRQVKLMAFVISSFFAGIAGGLFAHLLQFISPRVFDIIKSTDILIMVYLGGIGSLAGSILGATIYTTLLEVLRPLGVWRMVLMPLVLVLLMLYRPRGIMGLREFRWFVPARDLLASKLWRERRSTRAKEVADASAAG